MRHPLWLVDSTCLAFFLVAMGFAFFARQNPQKRISLETKNIPVAVAQPLQSLDISQIYENDLFNTYHRTAPPLVETDYTTPLPTPPTQTVVTVPTETPQPFIAPLEIKLKGIILVDDHSENTAIIADAKTDNQNNYSVGDVIEDARIVRILQDRVILVRSNGQQETLYINAKDSETDPALTEERNHWTNVVKKLQETNYYLDPETFVYIVRNVAQFIDILDLTTVYKKGQSIGCRVGAITKNSLGAALGLEQNDIITHINGIEIASTETRIEAYQSLAHKTFGDTVPVIILKNGFKKTYSYTLHDLKDPLDESLEDLKKINSATGAQQGPSENTLQQEKINLLKEKYKFAQTAQDIKIAEKRIMLQKGGRDQVKNFSLDKE